VSVRARLAAAACIASLLAAGAVAEDGGSGRLVDASDYVPDLVLDLRYATRDNFLGRKVYPDNARCLLLPEAAERLKKAADQLRPKGFRLRVYDCYRPLSVQWEMWKILPKPGYVADPRKGSHHNRGAAVDLTLAYEDGEEVKMPTPFDTFTRAAHHGYQGGDPEAIRHRELLREAMEQAGFRKNRMEWWHYALPDAGRKPVLDEPLVR
jgi:zinc D-Ala-D-Ala dipeptidase